MSNEDYENKLFSILKHAKTLIQNRSCLRDLLSKKIAVHFLMFLIWTNITVKRHIYTCCLCLSFSIFKLLTLVGLSKSKNLKICIAIQKPTWISRMWQLSCKVVFLCIDSRAPFNWQITANKTFWMGQDSNPRPCKLDWFAFL